MPPYRRKADRSVHFLFVTGVVHYLVVSADTFMTVVSAAPKTLPIIQLNVG